MEQQKNPELNVRANTGLFYKSAIGKLKIVSANLNNCQEDPRSCTTQLNGFSSPDGDDYDFGDAAQFQSFSELGFPDPVIVSSVPGMFYYTKAGYLSMFKLLAIITRV